MAGSIIIPGIIIDPVWNMGVSYGMGATVSPVLLTCLIVIITGVTGLVLWRDGYYLSLSCIAGGALGNIHDRLSYGAVFDFISLKWGEYYWPTVFNIADIFIVVGGLLVLKDLWSARSY